MLFHRAFRRVSKGAASRKRQPRAYGTRARQERRYVVALHSNEGSRGPWVDAYSRRTAREALTRVPSCFQEAYAHARTRVYTLSYASRVRDLASFHARFATHSSPRSTVSFMEFQLSAGRYSHRGTTSPRREIGESSESSRRDIGHGTPRGYVCSCAISTISAPRRFSVAVLQNTDNRTRVFVIEIFK